MNSKASSYSLTKTEVPSDLKEPRLWYIRNFDRVPPPWIAHSSFVPPAMVQDLMREKKDSAIGVKFEKKNTPPDRITNMEGALHTFVTPIIDATIHGDYIWKGGHSIHRFGSHGNYQLGRRVLISALVHQDYEDSLVMMRVASCEVDEIIGRPEFPEMLHWTVKQDDVKRKQYNTKIHRYLIYHLTQDRILPSVSAVVKYAMTMVEALDFLELAIRSKKTPATLPAHMQGRFIKHHKGYIMSLEVMFNAAVHQTKNEIYLLETICPSQGYVYTFNPPKIFVRYIGKEGPDLLSLIHIAALKYVQTTKRMKGCRCIAWDDFSTPGILSLIRHALPDQPHIQVHSKSDLFQIPEGMRDGIGEGLYGPPREAEDALLVIHNNSDGFGQNIETEPAGGSLDGVIGFYSSASGSLMRHRHDLCDRMYRIV